MCLPLSDSQRNDNAIGFSAYKFGGGSVQPSSAVVFDRTYLNVGNDYNTGTGEFTCPVSGLYYITVTIKNGGSGTWVAGLQRQDTVLTGNTSVH